MSTPGRRDELIALVVIVVLVALVMGVVAFLGRDGGDPPDAAADQPAATRTPTPTSDPDPEQEPTDEATPATQTGPEVGGTPYLYACQLVPRADVQRIFGAFGADARTRQTYLDRTPTSREPAAPATRVPGGLTTSCDYTFADPAGHTLEVSVTQVADTRALARRWSRLPQARKVKGTNDLRILPARRSFALRGDGFIADVRYSTFGDAARKRPLSAREVAWQVPRMRKVLAAVSRHVADGTATAGPQPTNADLGPTVGSTPYVEPCALLTDEAFAATGGARRPGPVDVDSSYLAHDPYTDAPVSSCERRGTQPAKRARDARTTFAVLEVRVAADPASAQEVEAKHLDNRYPRGTKVHRVRTAAGTAYVVNLGGTDEWPWRSRAIQVVVGSYELHLSVLRDVTPGRPYGRWVSEAELVAAADELIGAMESATE
ncbi:hypothetical protein [Nocardioides conyzicola]|uniref:hypothetical protein n=1 Tax=Nocardioides conyzicola TaxID=1651781 RepID=UPI0031EEC431